MRPDGSSPRVRGKPVGDAGDEVAEGLIPACAGKTPSAAKRALMSAAHPRVCGENWSTASRRSTASGSSPRVRGKRVRAVADGGGARLIPACAGKTSDAEGWRTCSAAHPRVCGENGPPGVRTSRVPGSSPRVRGKRGARRGGGVRVGLIPACAGKTPPPGVPASPRAAHPRVCGENRVQSTPVTSPRGSSPRVRGNLSFTWKSPASMRLIPACAGKTGRFSACAAITTAHPRVCGENSDAPGHPFQLEGSSPRVRGKPRFPHFGAVARGLIPACAGKT